MINHQTALIYTMVLCSAADGAMSDAELASMGDMVEHLPVFNRYDRTNIERDGAACAELLKKEDGLDRALDLIDKALPTGLRETAYALACDVVAADATAKASTIEITVCKITNGTSKVSDGPKRVRIICDTGSPVLQLAP